MSSLTGDTRDVQVVNVRNGGTYDFLAGGTAPLPAAPATVAAHFGLPSVSDVAIAVHKGKLIEDDLLRRSARSQGPPADQCYRGT